MHRLHFVTSNPNKVQNLSRVLGQYNIEVMRKDLDVPELQAETAEEVAVQKADYAYHLLLNESFSGSPPVSVLVNDSAFHIDSLNGFPGTNVKWTAKQIGLDGHLRLMSPFVTPAERTCAFVDAFAYMDAVLKEPKVFFRRTGGTVAMEARGPDRPNQKSALWRLYIPDGCTKTIGEMSDEEFTEYRSRDSVETVYHELGHWLQAHFANLTA